MSLVQTDADITLDNTIPGDDRPDDNGLKKLIFCSSKEISQIVNLLYDRDLNDLEIEKLNKFIEALFVERQREKAILSAIKWFGNVNIADSLEGLYLYFKSKNIVINDLGDIDNALTAMKQNRKQKKKEDRSCQFLEELTVE